MIKIYWVAPHKGNRESFLINQGLVNNSRVELVDNEKDSDFVFQFYYIEKHKIFYEGQTFPPEKTVLIDYHDNPRWFSLVISLLILNEAGLKECSTEITIPRNRRKN